MASRGFDGHSINWATEPMLFGDPRFKLRFVELCILHVPNDPKVALVACQAQGS